MKKIFVISSMIFILATTSFAAENPGAAGALDQESFTLEEMLHYAIQDEWLAEAEYKALMEAFDVSRPFSNIRQAELSHIAMLMPLFEKYEIDLPDRPDEAVIPASLEETYLIGIDAEIANIAMYEKFLQAGNLPEDVADVFTRLMLGSENHLAAFQRQADAPAGPANQDRSTTGMAKARGAAEGENRRQGRFGDRQGQNNRSLQGGNGRQPWTIQEEI